MYFISLSVIDCGAVNIFLYLLQKQKHKSVIVFIYFYYYFIVIYVLLKYGDKQVEKKWLIVCIWLCYIRDSTITANKTILYRNALLVVVFKIQLVI